MVYKIATKRTYSAKTQESMQSMYEAPKSIGPTFFGGDHDTKWEPLRMDFHHNDDHFRIFEPAYDEIFEN